MLVLVAGEHGFEFLEFARVGGLNGFVLGVLLGLLGGEGVFEVAESFVLALEGCGRLEILGLEAVVFGRERLEAVVEKQVAGFEGLDLVVLLLGDEAVLLVEPLEGVFELSVLALRLGELFVELCFEVLELLLGLGAVGAQLFLRVLAVGGVFHGADYEVLALFKVVVHLFERGVLVLDESCVVALNLDLALEVAGLGAGGSLGIERSL